MNTYAKKSEKFDELFFNVMPNVYYFNEDTIEDLTFKMLVKILYQSHYILRLDISQKTLIEHFKSLKMHFPNKHKSIFTFSTKRDKIEITFTVDGDCYVPHEVKRKKTKKEISSIIIGDCDMSFQDKVVTSFRNGLVNINNNLRLFSSECFVVSECFVYNSERQLIAKHFMFSDSRENDLNLKIHSIAESVYEFMAPDGKIYDFPVFNVFYKHPSLSNKTISVIELAQMIDNEHITSKLANGFNTCLEIDNFFNPDQKNIISMLLI